MVRGFKPAPVILIHFFSIVIGVFNFIKQLIVSNCCQLSVIKHEPPPHNSPISLKISIYATDLHDVWPNEKKTNWKHITVVFLQLKTETKQKMQIEKKIEILKITIISSNK